MGLYSVVYELRMQFLIVYEISTWPDTNMENEFGIEPTYRAYGK